MRVVSEFKEFIARGNVVDLAVGVIVGGAFGKIISSFVSDVLTPVLGLFTGGVNFAHLKLRIGGTDASPVMLNYGQFVQNVIDFLIIAAVVFAMVKTVNALKRQSPAVPEPPPEPPKQELLLAEIRDILKKQVS
ncbi:MAG: large-conductance mechanosensitive channel protein MscL [Acidobacteriota bacterium]|nr:large-conductance mechanosensitive channel protein MscL [Blastocatellia bacterium]MDW8412076.1 large-conductance mechanosensitive channel protein MscL [Acidobacteriota bacterium]